MRIDIASRQCLLSATRNWLTAQLRRKRCTPPTRVTASFQNMYGRSTDNGRSTDAQQPTNTSCDDYISYFENIFVFVLYFAPCEVVAGIETDFQFRFGPVVPMVSNDLQSILPAIWVVDEVDRARLKPGATGEGVVLHDDCPTTPTVVQLPSKGANIVVELLVLISST